MMLPRTSLNSLGNNSTNVCWNRVVKDPCTKTGASWLKKIYVNRDVSAQAISLLQHMNKLGKASSIPPRKNVEIGGIHIKFPSLRVY